MLTSTQILKDFDIQNKDLTPTEFVRKLETNFKKLLPNAWIKCYIRNKARYSEQHVENIHIIFGLIGDGNNNIDKSVGLLNVTDSNDPMYTSIMLFGNPDGTYNTLDPVRFTVRGKPDNKYMAFGNQKLCPPIQKKPYSLEKFSDIFIMKIKAIKKALKNKHEYVSFGHYSYEEKYFK